jgi:tetratricopeptide (TPR) repeat protein
MGIALQGVKERPLFGWGQENYAIVFDKYYDPRMYGQEPWFDRVHNIIFDWWIAGGTLGLVSYLSLFAIALWAIWRRNTQKLRAFSIGEGSILTGLLAGYFVHNLTVFDNVTSYIWFGTILAYIAWRTAKNRAAPILLVKDPVESSLLPYVVLAATVLTWGVAWYVNASALAQNRVLLKAVAPQATPLDNLAYFKQAVAYGAYGTQEAREQLAQGTSQLASVTTIPADTKQQFYSLAVAQMIEQEKEAPLDARFPLFLGILYSSYGDNANATTAFQRAHDLSPRKQTIYFQIGQNALTRGDNAGALNSFKTAYELDTSFTQARILYATVAIQVGQGALAEELLAPAIQNDTAADPRILNAYVNRKEYAKAVTIWQAHLASNPSDMQGYFTLAALYYQLGNTQKAIETLQAAEKQDPTIAAQAEPVIQQIRNGTIKLQ